MTSHVIYSIKTTKDVHSYDCYRSLFNENWFIKITAIDALIIIPRTLFV